MNELEFLFPDDSLQPLDLPFSAVLRRGDRSSDVKVLQRTLRALGYSLEPDGFFGPMTEQCVLTFQGSHGLVRNGTVGPETWRALDALAPSPADAPALASASEYSVPAC